MTTIYQDAAYWATKYDKARTGTAILACIALGLLVGLVYAGYKLNAKPAPAAVERCAADVMQLNPTTIRAARAGTVEI